MSEFFPFDSGSENSYIIKKQFPEENIYFQEDGNPNMNTKNNSLSKASVEQISIIPQILIGNKRPKPFNNEPIRENDIGEIKNVFINEPIFGEGGNENLFSEIKNIKKSKKRRRKFQKDLILMKVQNHYITFVIKLMNIVLDFFGYEPKYRFQDIEHSFKKNVKKNFFESLKKKKLYEVITNPISKKNHRDDNYDKFFNMSLYEKLKKDEKYETIINILNENYLILFRDIYYKNERNMNLKKYGKNDIITLSEKKIEMYNDIEKEDKDYINCIDKYVRQNYSSNIFKVK